jgi:hypothetical protein
MTLSSARRLAVSKDWMITGSFFPVSRLRLSTRTSGSSSGSPMLWKYVGCLVSGYTPIVRPSLRLSTRARSTTSWKVGTSNLPSNAVLVGRTCGSRSLARSVFSSASVKSSVNHPVTDTPSIVLVTLRPANSGRTETSVVPEISFSWRATRTPSLVETRSGSM